MQLESDAAIVCKPRIMLVYHVCGEVVCLHTLLSSSLASDIPLLVCGISNTSLEVLATVAPKWGVQSWSCCLSGTMDGELRKQILWMRRDRVFRWTLKTVTSTSQVPYHSGHSQSSTSRQRGDRQRLYTAGHLDQETLHWERNPISSLG